MGHRSFISNSNFDQFLIDFSIIELCPAKGISSTYKSKYKIKGFPSFL